MNTWKKIIYKTYTDESGNEATAPVEEQMQEILEFYNNGTVLVASVNHYGYECVEVLSLNGYVLLDENVDCQDLMGDLFNKACILNNDMYGAEYYMCIESPYDKKVEDDEPVDDHPCGYLNGGISKYGRADDVVVEREFKELTPRDTSKDEEIKAKLLSDASDTPGNYYVVARVVSFGDFECPYEDSIVSPYFTTEKKAVQYMIDNFKITEYTGGWNEIVVRKADLPNITIV